MRSDVHGRPWRALARILVLLSAVFLAVGPVPLSEVHAQRAGLPPLRATGVAPSRLTYASESTPQPCIIAPDLVQQGRRSALIGAAPLDGTPTACPSTTAVTATGTTTDTLATTTDIPATTTDIPTFTATTTITPIFTSIATMTSTGTPTVPPTIIATAPPTIIATTPATPTTPATTAPPTRTAAPSATTTPTTTPTATTTPTTTPATTVPPTRTAAPSATTTPTTTPSATTTPTATATNTATGTPTATATNTATGTPTATATNTATGTATPTVTNTVTGTATPTPTTRPNTPTPTPVPPTATPTPYPRILIALGDSVASGHHTGACDDPNYPPYNRVAYNRIVAAAPRHERWRYENVAHSGFGTFEVINGGRNACGQRIAKPPLKQATQLLASPTYKGHRNIVVISAGINNTNWITVIKRVVLGNLRCLNVIPQLQLRCQLRLCATIRATFNGFNPAVQAAITADVRIIVRRLRAADPSVTIIWTGYYSMAGTGNNFFKLIVPRVCDGPIVAANIVLQRALQAGLNGGGGTFLDISDLFNTLQARLARIQPLTVNGINQFVAALYTGVIGWPHPNRLGHALMGTRVYRHLQATGVVR